MRGDIIEQYSTPYIQTSHFPVKTSSLELRIEELEQKGDQLRHSHALEVAQLKLAQADEERKEREEDLLLQVAQLSDEKEGLVDKVKWRTNN